MAVQKNMLLDYNYSQISENRSGWVRFGLNHTNKYSEKQEEESIFQQLISLDYFAVPKF